MTHVPDGADHPGDAPDPDGPGVGPTIDWDALRDAARDIMTRAYVPYSHYPVGAAAIATGH